MKNKYIHITYKIEHVCLEPKERALRTKGLSASGSFDMSM